jgi:hypothetical protein
VDSLSLVTSQRSATTEVRHRTRKYPYRNIDLWCNSQQEASSVLNHQSCFSAPNVYLALHSALNPYRPPPPQPRTLQPFPQGPTAFDFTFARHVMSLGWILYWKNPKEDPFAICINSIPQSVVVSKQGVGRRKGLIFCINIIEAKFRREDYSLFQAQKIQTSL